MAEGSLGPPLGHLDPMLVAPAGGTSGVLRGSRGVSVSCKISKLLIPLPAQANSSPVRSAIYQSLTPFRARLTGGLGGG
jgi:hypothetical protein